VARFRNGRGRDNRDPRQQPQRQAPPPSAHGRQAAYGQQPGAGRRAQQWQGQGPAQAGPGGYDEPEYLGEQQYPNHPQYPDSQGPYASQAGPRQQPYGGGYGAPQSSPYQSGPYRGGIPSADPHPDANNPGHTQAFTVSDPYGDGATYRAGAAPAPPIGPRLGWKALLSGIVSRPSQTFLQMRDYPVWGPALIVTFLYGALVIFGFDDAREDVLHTTLSTAIPYVAITGVAFVIGGLILGAVTHTAARQLGGDGSWQPTVGLSMLIMSITDAPRLLFAAFLGGDNGFVQILGWLTWLAACVLFTSMVAKSHDLKWPKALGASAIQLAALLSLLKLGTF
jgi:hypothetical protein